MIGKIRRYPKIVLGIFSFCCFMFVGEYFIRLLFVRTRKVSSNMPDIVRVLGKELTFDDYKKKIDAWGDTYGSFYEKYKIERSSRLFRSVANNHVVNEFIEDVIFFKLAENLSIKIGAEEKNDVLFGDNIDDSLKRSFVDSDGRFDRSQYNNFIQMLANNVRLRMYWDSHVALIMKNRMNNKVKDILDSMSFTNLLEIKRKFVEKNSSYDVSGVFSYIKPEAIDYSKYGNEIKKYYKENKDLFKNDEVFKVKYFINKFDVNNDVKKYNLSNLSSLIDKFSVSDNPVEIAKARSDSDVNVKSGDYSKSFFIEEFPKCFNSNNSFLGSVVVDFPDSAGGLIKIYRIVNIFKANGRLRYDVVAMYKKLLIDEYTSNSLYRGVVERLKNVNNLDEFAEFANECGYKLSELDVNLKTADVKNFENIDVLKKELYKVGGKKKECVLPVIMNKNGVFVGYLCKYVAKGSLKTLDDVITTVRRRIRKNIEKNRANKEITDNAVYKKSISDLKKVKDFMSFSFNGVNMENIEKKAGRDKSLVRDIIKHSVLLNGETSFFKFGDTIIKINVKNLFDNNFNSDLFKEFINKSRTRSNRTDSYVKIFEDMYSVDKLEYAYSLL